jgi:hypothetical protein
MSKVYYSKKDSWLVAVYICITVICSFTSFLLVVNIPNLFVSIIVSAVTAAIGIVFPLWTLINTSYQIKEGLLIIKSGPLQWIVPLDSIQSITPTRDAASSPALSLDRIRITYGHSRSVLVSPEEQEDFLLEIKQHTKIIASPGV